MSLGLPGTPGDPRRLLIQRRVRPLLLSLGIILRVYDVAATRRRLATFSDEDLFAFAWNGPTLAGLLEDGGPANPLWLAFEEWMVRYRHAGTPAAEARAAELNALGEPAGAVLAHLNRRAADRPANAIPTTTLEER